MPPPTLDVKLIAGMRELGYKEIKLVSNLLTTSNGGTFSGGHLPEEVLDFSGRLLEQNGTRGARAWKGGWRRVEEVFRTGLPDARRYNRHVHSGGDFWDFYMRLCSPYPACRSQRRSKAARG